MSPSANQKDVELVSLSELEWRLDLVLRETRQQDIGVAIITTPDDIYTCPVTTRAR